MRQFNLLLIVTDSYIIYACPLILSVFKHVPYPIHIFFLMPSISKSTEILISNFIKGLGGTSSFYIYNKDVFEGFYYNERYPLFLYAKMVPHMFLPDNIERIISLDVDTIVMGDIEELYFHDFQNYLLIACHNKRSLRNLYMARVDSPYFQEGFNGGVILYNLNAFRLQINIDIYRYWLDSYKKLTHNEQEQFEEWVMANTLKNKFKLLMPFDYNYNISAEKQYDIYCRDKGLVPLKRIIHYQEYSVKKPWEYYDHFILGAPDDIIESQYYQYYRIWWNYAKELPISLLEALRIK